MNYSCLMEANNVSILKENDFSVEEIKENYFGITFEDNQKEFYENYIINNLKNGFWNEYIGKEKIFIFKFNDGSIKRFIYSKENDEEILNLCREFAKYEFISIDDMLRNNSFYSRSYYKTKILWSGITGRTGSCAQMASKTCDYAEIVAGICRSGDKYYNYNQLENIKEDFDVIVDFSHKDCFDKILEFAIEHNKVLVSGTSGISEEQLDKLEKASHIIPIFRGGNFRFNVENFINEVVDYARTKSEKLTLVETHYKTKKVPSETAKVVSKRVLDNAGKEVEIISKLEYDELINDWRVDDIHCRVQGFEQLGFDVLKIANMMRDKTPNGLYDLNFLLSEGKDKQKQL